MENKSTTKEFLQLCYKQVVDPALEEGLDEECYYLFLSEIYRAIVCDSGVRRKYHRMLADAEKKMIAKFNDDSDRVWRHSYDVIFRHQTNFIVNLGSFACASVKDEATMALAQGIVSFIRIQLHNQKRQLETIAEYAHIDLDSPTMDQRHPVFEDAYDTYQLTVGYLQGTIDHLESINY